ncbi:hypothetical protein [Actinoallomurus iriomotensis]|uniref:Uncharacterized protein n=1 Tax=Actinoallomurus iriomotensis TaxID=478107 RepID=A0A9W6VYF2_9ACTN|nr:hypothetical protein [Actinoallomurus iriomotensis]GLY83617.1 hypothetical protein Airi02_015460 [Actinoallomurus iriomotensis]
MGDPGMPIMAGLLAVPVGVLLFVIVLALMGRRWVTPAALADAPYEDDFDEPTPYAEPWGYYEPPRAPAPAPAPPAQQWHAPLPAPRPQNALPPAPRPQPQSYGRQPALPPGESRLALPSARPAYPSPPPESYGGYERPDPYRRSYERDTYGRDPYERQGEPEPDDSSQRGFPHGPYQHR